MDKIPYFDAHCDTISRCVETGEDFTGEDREFYAVPCSLRRSEGHIDLERTERAFSRYAQFFAFYRDGRGLTQRQMQAKKVKGQHRQADQQGQQEKTAVARLCHFAEFLSDMGHPPVQAGPAVPVCQHRTFPRFLFCAIVLSLLSSYYKDMLMRK